VSLASKSCAYAVLSLLNSTATPILNAAGQVIAVLAGRPKGEDNETWQVLHDAAYDAMETARGKVSFTKKQRSHRRGAFSALVTGVSFGGGQKVGFSEHWLDTPHAWLTGPWKSQKHEGK
jgi:hypothetical protein